MEYLRLTWTDVEKACSKIADEIRNRGLSNYKLIGISRGGLVPLRLISDYLLSQQVATMGMRFYVDIGRTMESPEVIFPVQGDVMGREIILIDDISDSGKSLKAARDHLLDNEPKKIVVTTLCKKPRTIVKPDIYAIETSAWVIFPWEVQETIRRIIDISKNKVVAEAELKKADISKEEYSWAMDSKVRRN